MDDHIKIKKGIGESISTQLDVLSKFQPDSYISMMHDGESGATCWSLVGDRSSVSAALHELLLCALDSSPLETEYAVAVFLEGLTPEQHAELNSAIMHARKMKEEGKL